MVLMVRMASRIWLNEVGCCVLFEVLESPGVLTSNPFALWSDDRSMQSIVEHIGYREAKRCTLTRYSFFYQALYIPITYFRLKISRPNLPSF